MAPCTAQVSSWFDDKAVDAVPDLEISETLT
jgi:hypothetical protein